MSRTLTMLRPVAPVPDKPHYILLVCVEEGGPLVHDQTYYALRGHRKDGNETWFDVWVEGEVRVYPDSRFRPANPENWWLFGEHQRRRFHVPPPWSRDWASFARRRQIGRDERAAA
ncbi:hypothetical protein [Asticcacaulis sp.]|uniref:hypothetical protein n=1 Tax=Asticcacaulis sp. TaxID=1872648 RepID=UPI003F7B3BD4